MDEHSNACKEQKVPLRILFIEDEPLQAEIALDWLQESGYDIDCDVVERKNDFLDRLKSGSYDLILADYYLLNWTALDAFHCLQEAGDDTPLILVTGTIGDEHAVECIKAGITDYVLKEKLVRLPTVVSRALQEKAMKEERKQAEKALRESEERYRQVNENIQDIIFSANAEGTITFINGACETLLGTPCGALLGKNLVKGAAATVNVPSEKLQQFMTEFTEAIKNARETIGYEFALEVRGELRYFEVKQKIRYDKEGNFIGTSGIARHITERKRIEEELKEHRDHLEDLVKERTAELETTNAQLTREIAERKQAEERVKHLNRLKEDLLRPHSFEKKLKHITDGVVAIFDADFARIWISKPGDLCDSGCFHARVTEGPHVCRYRDHCLYLMASSGRYTHIDGEVHRRVPFGCYKIGHVAAGEAPRFITNDVTHDPRIHNHDWAKKLGLVSFAGYQLLSAARKPIGVLALFSKHVISAEEDALLEGLANTTAQVIQTASAEEALRESEERFRALVETSSDWVWEVDRNAIYTYASPKVMDLLGYEPEEVIGKTPFDLMPSDEAERVAEMFQAIAESMKPFAGLENTNLHKDGHQVILETNGVPFFNTEGTFCGYRGIDRDITARKRAERVSKLDEERLEALLKLSQLTWRTERELTDFALEECVRLTRSKVGHLHFVNEERNSIQSYSWSKEVMKNCSVEKTPHYPLDEAGVWADCVRLREAVIHNDYRNLPEKKGYPEGHFPIIRHMSVPVFDEGKIVAIAGVGNKEENYEASDVRQLSLFMDSMWRIVKQRRAEEALRKLSRAVEQSPISIIITDRKGNIEYVNEAFSKITGYSAEEAIGQNPRILKSGDLPESRYKELWGTILSGKVWKGDLINKKKNGGNLWESISISPIWNDEGKITHFVAAKEDITHRKHLEEELIQAKLEAEAANRAKSEFLANMSHEIRTPLNAVLGYAQILQNAENLTTRQVDALKTIKSSGEHLLHLINEILDLSKIEAGHLELQLSEFHFPEFLNHLADMIRIRAEQKGLAFVYERAPDLPGGVYADEKRLRQVLLNVLGNAIKFTEKGSVTFKVKRIENCQLNIENWRREEDNFQSSIVNLQFEIEDTGIGIVPEKLEEIFLPFHQVGEQHGVVEGTGLGLPISQKLVRMMGGELHVESTVGQGSIFWFALDLPGVEGVIGRAAQPSHKIIGYKGKRCTVLVADDKRGNRTILVNMLLPLGFDIIEAENGEECIEKTMRFTPDMILLDLRMPVMDGFETARRIRELVTGYSILDTGIERPASSIQHPVIIAVSASAFEETRRKSLEAGCSDFLSKPFQVENLLELLQTHLRLEWVYKEAVEERTVTDFQSPIVSASDVSLPPEEVEILHRIAERGNVKHILEQLQHIEKLGDQFLPLVTELRTLAKSFQVDEIVERLKEMQE